MATPAQIRSERKKVLRQVKAELKTMDSLTEKLERKINQTLKLRKQLPDIEDATTILTQIRDIDKQLDKVITGANTFSNYVRTT